MKTDAATLKRVYAMSLAGVYPHYVAKAEKKGRTRAEVDEIIRWLTGYTQKQLESILEKRINIETFDDLESITATAPDGQIIEKRIRILSPETAQVTFRFGKEPSALAKKLGAAKLLVFEYSEKVSFDSGKAELKPEALPILNKQKEILNTYFPNAKAYVCGYTDSTGGDDLNLKLSLERANAVFNYLSAAGGVAKGRLEPKGFGKDFPLDSNATPSGRALNRRTEVVLPD